MNNLTSNLTQYTDVERTFAHLNCDYTPAEIQGIACGILSVQPMSDETEWLSYLFADAGIPAMAQEPKQLFEQVRQQLIGDELTFELLLPSDDEPLSDRLAALTEWAQGYMLGISMAGIKQFSDLSNEADELLTDFSEIAGSGELEFSDEDEDDAEEDFLQVVEYLRVGTLVITAELAAEATLKALETSPTLH